jgi:CheY-like chemotaxis protein
MSGNKDQPIHSPPETLLFVEDEALIRIDMAEFLRESGYRVHEAANANEAIEALKSKFAIDLVFIDINLPGMNGVELAKWTLSNSLGVKVLLTSGAAPETGIPQSLEPILAKPYTGYELLDRVRRRLAKQSGTEARDSRRKMGVSRN